MPEVIFSPVQKAGLKDVYHPQKAKDAPDRDHLCTRTRKFGGTMNNRVVYNLHYAFHQMGFTRAAVQLPRRGPVPGANTTRASASFPTRGLRRSTTFSRSTANVQALLGKEWRDFLRRVDSACSF